MQSKDLIIEIGTEEIPARFLEGIFADCRAKSEKLLAEKRLGFGRVEVFGTMRRLILGVSQVTVMQKDAELKIKGPSKAKAFSPEGVPSKTAEAFASSKGVRVDQLVIEKFNNTEYVFAVRHEKGMPSEAVLKDLVPDLMSSLYLPISMKWGRGDHVFIRPVHYIAAFFGGKRLACEAAGIESMEKVPAHKAIFNAKKERFAGKTVEDYKAFLKRLGVIACSSERRRNIEKGISGFLAEGVQFVPDGPLLSETADLVENPSVLRGKYKKDYCGSIPEAVISTVIKKQQKCFPVQGDNSFFIVADGRKCQEISSGYEQVVNARLADAKFFYDEDLKVPLARAIEKTNKITYLKNAGTMMDKTQRARSLCSFVSAKLGAGTALKKKAERAAELSKFDLATHLVGEFPSLAGVMGRCYAIAGGEDPEVADAVLEQYLPAFSGDRLPDSLAGAVLGLSDRIDTIACCFSAGIIPTGSEDPYALRRSAQGLVAILLGKDLNISLSEIIEESFRLLGGADPALKAKTADFILQRFKAVLEGDGAGREIAEAVINNADVLAEAYCRAFEIKKVVAEEWFKDLVMSADRVKRICPAASAEKIDVSRFLDAEESILYNAFTEAKRSFDAKYLEHDFGAALMQLSPLSKPLAVFFEKVLVMHEDPAVKSNRLALLSHIKELYERFADLSKIPV